MKQFRLSIAVLLSVWGLAGLGEARADDGSGVSGVKVVKSENKRVRLYTQAGSPVDVSIIDADGNVLYRGSVNNQTKRTTAFNLSSLPDGQYYLTAGNRAFWMSQGLTLRGGSLTVDERSLQRVAQPTLTTYEKNKIEMTLPATNVDHTNVTIYDAQSNPVYAETFKGSTRRFDLSSLPEGSYTFVVGPDQKQFSSRIDVRR